MSISTLACLFILNFIDPSLGFSHCAQCSNLSRNWRRVFSWRTYITNYCHTWTGIVLDFMMYLLRTAYLCLVIPGGQERSSYWCSWYHAWRVCSGNLLRIDFHHNKNLPLLMICRHYMSERSHMLSRLSTTQLWYISQAGGEKEQ